MLNNWFEWLFKLKPFQFSDGDVAILGGPLLTVIIFVLALFFAGLVFIYIITNIYPTNRSRWISIFLRIMAILVLFIPLFEPVLLTPDVIPNENFLVILADKSASMGISDGYFRETRDDDINYILNDPESGLLAGLQENFKVRYYAFGDDIRRVDSLTSVAPDKEETNIAAALKRVVSDYKGLPLTGIVLMTDGVDNSVDDPFDIISELKSMDIPVHVVGLGSETFERERELLDVTTGIGLEEGAGAEIDVKVRSWVNEKEPVTFNIFKGEEKVFSEERFLKGGGKLDYFTFFYEPDESGSTEYLFGIDGMPDEVNTENNTLSMLIDTQKDSIKVLYFEGHLRSDFKFIKRALEDDRVVEFTSVSRTGTNKYYRQGQRGKSVEALAGGFPTTEEQLYNFKAIIFGDIEASFFSIEQLEMIENFVRERGGGFMMLGGLNSFAEGNYWNSPIEDLLPVEIDPARKMALPPKFHNPNASSEDQGFKFVPTREGLESPILKLVPDYSANRAVWNEMPSLTSINYFGDVKPGATVLAIKPEDKFGGEEPLLVIQRYGMGRTAALGTSSTWRWQMMLEADDYRHERFWRQLVRWLIASAPDNVNIELADNLYAPGDEVPVRVTVFDDDYNSLNFVEINGSVTDPFGESQNMKFYPDLTEDGEYTAAFVPRLQGVYKINVEAEINGNFIGRHSQSILSRPSKKEYYNATLKKRFLENLAKESGGVYYDHENISDLTVNVKTRKTSTSIFRSEYLWDMPIIYLLAILFLSAEWIYRRRKGLP